MTIGTVKENLRNTIRGKNLLLASLGEGLVATVSAQFIEINIGELQRILDALEACDCECKEE